MLFINKKFFFINNLKHNILNNNYLFFLNNKINNLNYNTLDIKMLQANDIKKLNINNSNFLIKNTKLLMLKNLNSKINIKDVNFISFLGFVFNPKGRYKGQVPTRLVRINTAANTNKTIAIVPLITCIK